MVPVLLHCPQQELFLVRKVKGFFPRCQRPSVYLFAVVHPAGSWPRCPSLLVTVSAELCALPSPTRACGMGRMRWLQLCELAPLQILGKAIWVMSLLP